MEEEEENDKKVHQNINNEITNLTTSNMGFEIPAGLSTITEGFREMAKLVVNTPKFIESMRETFTALHRNISALLIGTIKTSEFIILIILNSICFNNIFDSTEWENLHREKSIN